MADAKPNGVKNKGKAKALDEDDEDEDDDEDSEDDEEGADLENFVICTLDTERVRITQIPYLTTLLNVSSRTTSSPLTSPSTMARRSSSWSPVPTPST
jgi:hypothetical protein